MTYELPLRRPALAASSPVEEQKMIHLHFPVEIEVRAGPEPINPEEIVQEVLSRLARSLEST